MLPIALALAVASVVLILGFKDAPDSPGEMESGSEDHAES
jgi:hypothetical protein